MKDHELDQAIKRIQKFLKETKMTESRLGLMACANQHAIPRIYEGNALVSTLRQVLEFLDIQER